jgi:hypothetical protein
MQSIFANAERVLAAVAGLALFALNDVRMFHWLPDRIRPVARRRKAACSNWSRIASCAAFSS